MKELIISSVAKANRNGINQFNAVLWNGLPSLQGGEHMPCFPAPVPANLVDYADQKSATQIQILKRSDARDRKP